MAPNLQGEGAPEQLVRIQETEVLDNHLDVTVADRDVQAGELIADLSNTEVSKHLAPVSCLRYLGNDDVSSMVMLLRSHKTLGNLPNYTHSSLIPFHLMSSVSPFPPPLDLSCSKE